MSWALREPVEGNTAWGYCKKALERRWHVSVSNIDIYKELFYLFLAALQGMWDLSSATRDPQQWKYGVLTTGLLGKPQEGDFIVIKNK